MSTKRIVQLILVITLVVGGWLVYFLNQTGLINLHSYAYYSVCDTPITYKIGKIDSEFHVSEDEFLQSAQQATTIWNQALNKKLFTYDPQGTLTLRLSYDQRQGLSTEINTLQQELDAKKNSLDPDVAAYQQQADEYERKLDSLNQDIEMWNQRGGAPQDVYQQLTKRQEELRAEAGVLQTKARELKQSTTQFNQEVGQLNQTVDTFNDSLKDKPEEGVYNPKDESITVYFNNKPEELIHTLAHEFGHARGLEHLENPEAIMYPKTNDVIVVSSDDLSAMNEVCAERPITRLLQEKLQNVALFLRSLMTKKS